MRHKSNNLIRIINTNIVYISQFKPPKKGIIVSFKEHRYSYIFWFINMFHSSSFLNRCISSENWIYPFRFVCKMLLKRSLYYMDRKQYAAIRMKWSSLPMINKKRIRITLCIFLNLNFQKKYSAKCWYTVINFKENRHFTQVYQRFQTVPFLLQIKYTILDWFIKWVINVPCYLSRKQ